VASAPIVDGDRLVCIVGGAEHAVVAFDKHTGHELWRALDAKEPGYFFARYDASRPLTRESIEALLYPLILGLGRVETTEPLRRNVPPLPPRSGSFQFKGERCSARSDPRC
jgi:hypothetical protein